MQGSRPIAEERFDAFLCHAGTDKPAIRKLRDRLRADGFDAWFDEDAIGPGDVVLTAIERGLRASRHVFVCLSGSFVQSKWAREEWQAALHAQIDGLETKVVPVVVAELVEAEIPLFLASRRREDLRADDGYRRLTELLQRTRAAAGLPRAAPAPPPSPLAGAPRTDDFVGRQQQLEQLRAALLPETGTPGKVAIVALHGMAGVGKSYLADRFAHLFADHFPGGYIRLVLGLNETRTADELLVALADHPALRETGARTVDAVAGALRGMRALLHIENVDTPDAAAAAAEVADRLQGCPIILTSRVEAPGHGLGWTTVDVGVFDTPTSLSYLERKLGRERVARERAAFDGLVTALGGLPLALSLAAGYLSRPPHTPDTFLELLKRRGLALVPADTTDPKYRRERNRQVLASSFEISLATLREVLGADAERLMAGLAALGHAPTSGFGSSLGAALAGLSEVDFTILVDEAVRLSVVHPVSTAPRRWALHPLIATHVRAGADETTVISTTASELGGK